MMLNLKNIERIRTSKNPQEAMNRFRSLRLQPTEQEPEPQVLGAGKIGCCRFQSIKNLTNWLGLVKEEE